jgi:hypothetical protein
VAAQHNDENVVADVEAEAIQRFIAEGSTFEAGSQWLDNARRLLTPSSYLRAIRFRTDSHLLAWDECVRIAELLEGAESSTPVARLYVVPNPPD